MGMSLRLADVLRHCKETDQRSYLGLEKEIKECYEKTTRKRLDAPPIDRRKLKKIIEREPNLTFSTAELEALDAYLALRNEGLAEKPLFRRDGVVDALAQKTVTFFLGARSEVKPHPRSYLSVWDVQAYSVLQEGINVLRLNTRMALKPMKDMPRTREQLLAELQALGSGTGVCSIGAPRSCPMSEVMLTEMFSVGKEAFEPPSGKHDDIPFYFVWPPQREVQSRFALPCSEIEDPTLRQKIIAGDAWVIVLHALGPKALDLGDSSFSDFGIIAAQRRDNQVWVTISGLSGPGTLAAAESLLQDVNKSRIHSVPEPPVVLYAFVEATVATKGGDKKSGDRRELVACRLIGGPEYWSPSEHS